MQAPGGQGFLLLLIPGHFPVPADVPGSGWVHSESLLNEWMGESVSEAGKSPSVS